MHAEQRGKKNELHHFDSFQLLTSTELYKEHSNCTNTNKILLPLLLKDITVYLPLQIACKCLIQEEKERTVFLEGALNYFSKWHVAIHDKTICCSNTIRVKKYYAILRSPYDKTV